MLPGKCAFSYIAPGKITPMPQEVDCSSEVIKQCVLSCRPACECIWASTGGTFFCRNVHCRRHGQKQRIDRKEKVLSWGVPTVPAAAVVLHFDAFVSFSEISMARSSFLNGLRQRVANLAYVWTLEWVDFIPHLHMTISRFTSDLPLAVRECWVPALADIGLPNPERRRTYCRPVEDYEGWIDYIFKAGQVLPARQCRPKMRGQRCAFSNHSKNYPVEVTGGPSRSLNRSPEASRTY
jgi:hypothetical protein